MFFSECLFSLPLSVSQPFFSHSLFQPIDEEALFQPQAYACNCAKTIDAPDDTGEFYLKKPRYGIRIHCQLQNLSVHLNHFVH